MNITIMTTIMKTTIMSMITNIIMNMTRTAPADATITKNMSIIITTMMTSVAVAAMTTTTITKDTIIGDILDVAPQTAPIFLSIGMHCLGCPSSRGETVEEACAVHGIDVDKLLALVNEEANKSAQ